MHFDGHLTIMSWTLLEGVAMDRVRVGYMLLPLPYEPVILIG